MDPVVDAFHYAMKKEETIYCYECKTFTKHETDVQGEKEVSVCDKCGNVETYFVHACSKGSLA